MAEALIPSNALTEEERSMLPKALWKSRARNTKIIVTECGCERESVISDRRAKRDGKMSVQSVPEKESA